MKQEKAARREQNRFRRRYGMRVAGRSLKSVLLPLMSKIPTRRAK